MKAIDTNLARMDAEKASILQTKDRLEGELNRALPEQDLAFLSMALLKERERAALEAELHSIKWLLRLPQLLQQERESLAEIVAREQAIREALKEVRAQAEADRAGLDRFAGYFLDCPIRAGVPGITHSDRMEL